ncbi:nematocyst expressed protein 3-like [Schistocerca cancellata]|uniref:nematocyst expressed protein 3-like n=1 Tax=Schistocerca cancellata TaxID=274614 RepID=UPI00211891E6|nr:nematocyst expressed protein 3-like [Schistocerca cancellata]
MNRPEAPCCGPVVYRLISPSKCPELEATSHGGKQAGSQVVRHPGEGACNYALTGCAGASSPLTLATLPAVAAAAAVQPAAAPAADAPAMSREEGGVRAHRSRLLALSELPPAPSASPSLPPSASAPGPTPVPAPRAASAGKSGRRAATAPRPLVRDDPSFTPNIEHLVFPDRRNSNPSVQHKVSYRPPPMGYTQGHTLPGTGSGSRGKAGSSSKACRSRLAEVFALSRHAHSCSAANPPDKAKPAKASSSKKGSAASNIVIVISPTMIGCP